MAKKVKRAQFKRLPSFTGRLMFDTVRGSLRVRKWPRKRGTPTSPQQLFWIDWFRQANYLAKYASAYDQRSAIQFSQGTPLYPRDLLLSAMRGRLYWLTTTDGRKLYPMAALESVSDALDSIGQAIGTLLVRENDLWSPLTPDTAGYVLTDNGPGAQPTWQPPSGGGGGYKGGARLVLTGNVNISAGAWTPIPWPAEDFDDWSLHDNAVNPSRITIPLGVTKVRFSFAVRWGANSQGNYRKAAVFKNGVTTYVPGLPLDNTGDFASTFDPVTAGAGGVVSVNAGDYFELMVIRDGASTVAVAANPTWFECEVIA